MHYINYKIKTNAPVIISKSSGDMNLVSTLDYIPGTVVLGMFAGRYIHNKNIGNDAHTKPEFQSWFLNSNIIFTNAYIVSYDVGRKYNTFPTPYSIHQLKEDNNVGIDKLFDDEDDEEKKRTETLSGFRRPLDSVLYNQPVNKSINFHQERDPITGVSQKGKIFNYESIDSGQEFEGTIISDENSLNGFLTIFRKDTEFYLGRSRNSQYGKIEFEFLSTGPEVLNSDIDTSSNKISLTFLSDVIIYNKNGFSTTDITDLEIYLIDKLRKSSLKIKKAFIKKGVIENYVSVWNLKKPSENCFKAGSCFLLEFGDINNVLKDLIELQIQGIGERKAEGFGRVRFGLQKTDEYELKENKDILPEKPTNDIPPIAKEIIRELIQKQIVMQINLNAINDVSTFVRTNTGLADTKFNSLISRLESFVISSTDITEFRSNIKKLRDIAKNKLQDFRLNNNSFYNFLIDDNIKINANKVLENRNFTELNTAEIESIYNAKIDINFNKILFKDYFITFFSTLRKKLKK